MQIPEEWSRRQRNSLATSASSTFGGGSNTAEDASSMPMPATGVNTRATTITTTTSSNSSNAHVHHTRAGSGKLPRSIANRELESFANDIATKNVSLNTHFIQSVGNDTKSITNRILEMLPDQALGTEVKAAKKRARAGEEAGDPETTATTTTTTTTTTTSSLTGNRYDMKLELDTLLSRLPYKRMMQDILPCNTEKPMPSVPHVTRVYEEAFMREPMRSTERQCVMGNDCECMHIDKSNPFVGVEFIIPNEGFTCNSATPQMCVLCSRANTQQLFYDIIFDNLSFNGLIQRFGNLHGVMNEYSQDVMLICPPNGPIHAMPLPIVSHERNRYSVVKVGGVKYIRQHGVYFQ